MNEADPTRVATVDGVSKMPPPMMPPITAIVAENRPSRRAYVTAEVDALTQQKMPGQGLFG